MKFLLGVAPKNTRKEHTPPVGGMLILIFKGGVPVAHIPVFIKIS